MRYRLHAEREKEGGKEGRLPEHEGGFMRAVLMNGAFLSREGRRWWSVCTEGRGKNKRLGEKSSPEREADTRNLKARGERAGLEREIIEDFNAGDTLNPRLWSYRS
jgi:hypothetical protein